jgi:transposase-like protein
MAARRTIRSGRHDRPGLRAYWSLHFEAWQCSGLSKRGYCAEHRLDRRTFDRWLTAIGDKQALSHKAPRKIRHPPRRPRSEAHELAVRAFWAMHVEAQRWCGLTAETYARAHHLSAPMLRQWRRRLEADPDPIDWPALVHPSARPPLEGTISTRTRDGSALTRAEPLLRERRRFSEAEKRAILAEVDTLGVTVTAVARRHGIIPGMLFRWRVQLGLARPERATFAHVRLTDGAVTAPVRQVQLPVPDGAMAVELPGGRRVFAPPGGDPDAVRRFVTEREGRS